MDHEHYPVVVWKGETLDSRVLQCEECDEVLGKYEDSLKDPQG